MADRIVVNASPLIVLANVGRLSLLQALAGEVIIPESVAVELLAGEPGDPASSHAVSAAIALASASRASHGRFPLDPAAMTARV